MTAKQLEVSVQFATRAPGLPPEARIVDCVRQVFGDRNGEIVVRIVDADESALLNERYRQRQGPTNVLAFAAGDWPGPVPDPVPLGDIVICAPVVASEAREQGKRQDDHWAHMVVHGCLHLDGYDHETPAEAAEMEQREREILAGLGIGDPFAARA